MIPSNSLTSFDIITKTEKQLTSTIVSEKIIAQRKASLKKLRGHLVNYPINFLSSEALTAGINAEDLANVMVLTFLIFLC